MDFNTGTGQVAESLYMMHMHVTHKVKYVVQSLHIKSIKYKAYPVTKTIRHINSYKT